MLHSPLDSPATHRPDQDWYQPHLPERIGGLQQLALNLWWTWHQEAREVFRRLDYPLWRLTAHNPVRMLHLVPHQRLQEAARDPTFLALYEAALERLGRALTADDSWWARTFPQLPHRPVAYFSAEFALHQSLPIYSGGLGILAGDHCKEASDLGIPLIGVGFLYPQGYFNQRITREGRQEALYNKLHFSEVPAVPAIGPDGNEVVISVDLPGRRIYAKVWKLLVGRVPLYLMDTDVAPNAPGDR